MKKQLLTIATLLMFAVSGQLLAQQVDDTGLFNAIKAGSTETILHATVTFTDGDANGTYDAGLALSAGEIAAWGDYSGIVRFRTEGLDVRDGSGFTKTNTVTFVPGETVELWFDINVEAKTYSTWAKTSSMDNLVVVQLNAGFRRTDVDSIARWSCLHNPGGEQDLLTLNSIEFVASVPEPNSVKQKGNVLYVVGGVEPLHESDSLAIVMMENTGYTVTTIDDDLTVVGDTAGMDVVVISSTVASGKVRTKFHPIEVPMINWEQAARDEFFTAAQRGNVNLDPGEITLVNDTHPMATGLSAGTITIGQPGQYSWGTPYIAADKSAVLLATLINETEEVGAWCVYEKGDSAHIDLTDKADFPSDGLMYGMRIELPFNDEIFLIGTPEAATMLLNSIAYAVDGDVGSFIPVARVDIPDDTLNIVVGKKEMINANVFPSNVLYPTVSYTCLDESVLQLDALSGKITALKAGSTKVVVETKDGAYTDTVVVNVTDDGKAAILFLVDDAAGLNASDYTIVEMMENTGYTVNVLTGGDSDVSDTLAQDVVIVSSTLSSGTVRDKFKWIELPILCWENGAYDDFGMTNTDRGTTTLDPPIMKLINDTHPMTSGLLLGDITLGDVGTYTRGTPYAAVSNSSVLLGTISHNGTDVGGWFIYEVGDSLDPGTSGEEGFPADGLAMGMRIGLPLEDNTFANPTPECATMLLNSIDYAADKAIESVIPTAATIIGGVSNDTLRLALGQDSLISAAVFPSNAADKVITYLSRDESIATYIDGTATSVAFGGTYVLAEAGGLTDSIYVLIEPVAVTGVSLDQATASIEVGETVQLEAIVTPDNATTSTVTWSSGDIAIATVDANGLVTGVSAGVTTITATTDDGSFTASADITVTEPVVAVTGVSLDQTAASIEVGQTVQLTATVAPEGATDNSVTWSSANESIATVDANGLVTGVSAGITTITVTTVDGSFTQSAEITVTSDVSVKGIHANQFNIYPNPVQDILTIEGVNISEIEVYNVMGNKIMHVGNNVTDINVSNLHNGIYLLKITTDEGTTIARFVKDE